MFSGEDAYNHVTDDVDDLIPPPPPPLDDIPQAKRLKTEGLLQILAVPKWLLCGV